MLTSQSVPAGHTILHSNSGKLNHFLKKQVLRTTKEAKHYLREQAIFSPTASHPLPEQK